MGEVLNLKLYEQSEKKVLQMNFFNDVLVFVKGLHLFRKNNNNNNKISNRMGIYFTYIRLFVTIWLPGRSLDDIYVQFLQQ